MPSRLTLAPSGPLDRAPRNLAAMRVLDRIGAGGEVTDDDRAGLGLWTGWGALPQVFSGDAAGLLADLAGDVRAGLSDSEWNAASASTLNAHYTTPEVIDAVLALTTAAGFTGGRVLEPGCGGRVMIRFPGKSVGARREDIEALVGASDLRVESV